MGFKKVIFTVTFLLFFGLFFVDSANAQTSNQDIDQPTIISIGSSQEEYSQRPIVKGLTHANTEVLVYIDGLNYGLAKVNTEGTESDNFYFQPSTPLSLGRHTFEFYSVAKDANLKSKALTKEVFIKELPAPTVLKPNTTTITSHPKTLIEGVTKSSTFVHVFIDGVYNGKTNVVTDKSGTAYFSYRPFLNLNVGRHSIQTVAETVDGLKSGYSQKVDFVIENKLPAPVVIKVIDNKIVFNKPIITGVVKNDLKVKVFFDNKLEGEFDVKNHPSGTANFAYHPKSALKVGKHLVYATTVDKRGKESIWSNIIYFNVVDPNAPKISDVAVTEKADKVVNNEVIELELKDGKLSEKEEDIKVLGIEKEVSDAADTEEATATQEETTNLDEEVVSIKDEGLEEILNSDQADEDIESGLIDEDENNQSGIKMNLVIFILFLFAVVAWIFWVNRELIKERKEEEGKNSENNQEKLDFKENEKSKKKK